MIVLQSDDIARYEARIEAYERQRVEYERRLQEMKDTAEQNRRQSAVSDGDVVSPS
jgi:hypothetical protein